eukprot:8335516-Alexandrium_andersonii.AAC.1
MFRSKGFKGVAASKGGGGHNQWRKELTCRLLCGKKLGSASGCALDRAVPKTACAVEALLRCLCGAFEA